MLAGICLLAAAIVPGGAHAKSRIEIDLGKRGAEIPASLYGVFFEEITGSGDGGLYAEMIRNRGFEGGGAPVGLHARRRRLRRGPAPALLLERLDQPLPHPVEPPTWR